MRRKLINIILIFFTLLLIFLIFVSTNYVFVMRNTNSNYKIGIIDGNLSNENYNIIYSDNTNFSGNVRTHGDELITFIFDCQNNVNLYYFDATNEEGEIDTTKIIEGLEWMDDNSVDRVNISLSNTIKHKDLESWILEDKEISIYASYNNRLNSFDYPAMYKGVFASGSDSRIKYKDIDYRYKSNKILLLNKQFKIYHGNSFLSVLSMLKN